MQSRINGQHSWAKFCTLLRFSMQPRRSKGSPSGIRSATKYDVGMPPTLGMNACAKELATNSKQASSFLIQCSRFGEATLCICHTSDVEIYCRLVFFTRDFRCLASDAICCGTCLSVFLILTTAQPREHSRVGITLDSHLAPSIASDVSLTH